MCCKIVIPEVGSHLDSSLTNMSTGKSIKLFFPDKIQINVMDIVFTTFTEMSIKQNN